MTKSIDFTFWLPPVQNGVFPKIPDNANFEKNTYVCYDEDVSSPDIPCVRKWIPGKWSDPIHTKHGIPDHSEDNCIKRTAFR